MPFEPQLSPTELHYEGEYPETWFNAYLQANSHFPQRGEGLLVLLTDEILRTIKTGSNLSTHLPWGFELSDVQKRKLEKAVSRKHEQYEVQYDRGSISTEKLARLVQSVTNISRAALKRSGIINCSDVDSSTFEEIERTIGLLRSFLESDDGRALWNPIFEFRGDPRDIDYADDLYAVRRRVGENVKRSIQSTVQDPEVTHISKSFLTDLFMITQRNLFDAE